MNECINMNNYHVSRYIYQLDQVLFEDVYFKDGNALKIACFSQTNHFDDTDIAPVPNFIDLYYKNKNYSYLTDPISKIKYYREFDQDFTHDYNLLLASDKPSLLSFILQSVLARIDSTKCNGIDCYRLISNYDGYNQYSYFNKKTGFPVRGANPVTLQNGQEYLLTTDLFIEFGTVTDEDLKVPNAEDYKPFEEVKVELILAELKQAIEYNELERIKSDLQYMLDENIEIPSEYYEKYKYLLDK